MGREREGEGEREKEEAHIGEDDKVGHDLGAVLDVGLAKDGV